MKNQDKNMVEIFADIKRETTGAFLVDDGSVEVWLPKSQIDVEDINQYRQGTILVPECLAVKKGLV